MPVYGYDITTGLTEFALGTGNAGRCLQFPTDYLGKTLIPTTVSGDTLTKISFYTRNDNAFDVNWSAALYEISGGVPTTRQHAVVTTVLPASQSLGWLDSAPLSISLTAGRAVSIGFACPSGAVLFALVSSDFPSNIARDTGGLQSTWVPQGIFSTYIPCLTFEITNGGGGGVTIPVFNHHRQMQRAA
jgi:hypothetical protein